MELLGCELKTGTVVVGCIYLTHQREDIYPEAKKAQLEIKLVLATILSRYQLALASQHPEKPQRRGVTPSLLLVAYQ